MVLSLVQIGNSQGVRFPKAILEQLGMNGKINMRVTENGIVLTPITNVPRYCWSESFIKMHERHDDELVDIPNSGEFEWIW